MLSSSCFNIILTLNEGRKKKKKKDTWTVCDVPISRAGLLADSDLSVPIVPCGIFHKEPGHLHQYTAMDLPSLRHREILAYGSMF